MVGLLDAAAYFGLPGKELERPDIATLSDEEERGSLSSVQKKTTSKLRIWTDVWAPSEAAKSGMLHPVASTAKNYLVAVIAGVNRAIAG